jgi:predicted DCC family thiol-disulfide oxidoreductase YuxK
VAFILGWQYRWTGPAFGLLLLVLLSYRNSWSMLYHNDNVMVLHVLILGFVRAADAWSWDSWRSGTRPESELVHWRYGWPVQLVCAATTAGYFLAGLAKVAGESGWSWASGESLRGQIAADAIRKALLGESTSALSFFLYDHLWLFTIIGVMSLVVELGAPLALLDRRAGMFWAINAFLMHWGIFFIMSIAFRYQMSGFVFLSFFAVERTIPFLRGFVQRRTGTSRPPLLPEPDRLAGARIVVYDGRCSFCQGQMRILRSLDIFDSLRYLSLHDPRTGELLPEMSFEALMQAMVVVGPDRRRYTGAVAVRHLSRSLPALWPLAPLLHIPGSFGLWSALYDTVARVRYRISGVHCEDRGTCRLPS